MPGTVLGVFPHFLTESTSKPCTAAGEKKKSPPVLRLRKHETPPLHNVRSEVQIQARRLQGLHAGPLCSVLRDEVRVGKSFGGAGRRVESGWESSSSSDPECDFGKQPGSVGQKPSGAPGEMCDLRRVPLSTVKRRRDHGLTASCPAHSGTSSFLPFFFS